MLELLELIKILLLSVVQGVTEWLPVSSTGHMILLDDILSLKVSEDFLSVFLVVVQLGSIMAVVYLYFGKLNPFSKNKTKDQQSETWNLWKKVLVATIPAAVIGLFLDDYMDSLNSPWVVAMALIGYGILFIVIEKYRSSYQKPAKLTKIEDITYSNAVKVGLFQSLSLVPGTSRSGSTIIGGLLLGGSRELTTEFSFFMGIPIMFGASFLKIIKHGLNYTGAEIFYLLFGMTIAFVVSIFTIRVLLRYIKRHSFEVFGYYRIILGVVVLALTIL